MEAILTKYLKFNKYSKLDCEEFKENYYSHPDYPSLYAVTESLELMGVNSVASMVSKEQIAEIPNTFIALKVESDYEEIVLVNRTKDRVKIQNNKGEKNNLSIQEFVKIWNGVVLLIEENEQPKKNRVKVSLIPTAILIIVLALGTTLLSTTFSIRYFLMQILSAFGILLSIFIIQEDIGRPNPFIAKTCNSVNKSFSCSSVIKSNKTNLAFGVTFADLPILFFSSSFLVLGLGANNFNIIGFISVLSLPILFYTFYLQKFILKKWCVLCLLSGVVVFSQSLLYLYHPDYFSFNSIFIFLIILISLILLWILLKELLRKSSSLSDKIFELNRFKRDFYIFKTLYSKMEITNSTEKLQGIEIGKKEADIQIDLFLSPSCEFCYETYSYAHKLLELYPDKVKLKIFFNLLDLDDIEDSDLWVARKIIQYYIDENSIEPINNWFLERILFIDWDKKWNGIKVQNDRVDSIIEKHIEFCTVKNWNYAPIVLLDGSLLPSQYNIEDIKYFVNEIIYNKKLSKP